ncbi:DUF3872 domain-containing protein [Chryseobacterium sp. MEBOG07]|uniref:DUF3872 domain-containing protein n=1 Tax=Chryseobacterium sp. MEBOG07 TaxID=2879939 RepID=UPI001F3007B5|nr:DUF3872 domain-containing protein [Chryseobacterium sp. MEBOG07]UKB78598.1 DUF3872 domain-containing protein [Chryseobacterium sp. MEBOG07]
MNCINNKKVPFVQRLHSLLTILPILFILLTLASCDKELDVKTDFPFELKVMPVPKSITKGETVTIRCTLKPQGNYKGTEYYIRYFQFDGRGKLQLGNNKPLKPNDSYSLTEQQFRLYYVSESNVTQAFDVWISNNHGHEQKVSFQFNAAD